ncbi:bacterio-opsin activator domain-containing protein [Halomarina litorea]|uniref:bacterio-opsin activator domain-containing protein n=1 Tax=Halomarina litorea TaxID=2961595 RepID=UPI0020C2D546|nr:bacterio-opsin activator domain-containing protein [Halomarina sp. BCD28]
MAEQAGTGAPFHDKSTTDVLERVTDAVFALDGEGRFTYLNERAEHIFGRDGEELLGEVVWEAFPEATDSTVRDAHERAMATQEPVSFEEYYAPLDSWVEMRAYPSETGLSVYLRDVTDRVRRENRLEGRERALRRAYEVLAGNDRTFEEKVDALLEVVREAVGTRYATLSRVRDDEYVFEAIAVPDGTDVQPGERIPLDVTNCERVVSSGQSLVLDDIEGDAPDLAAREGNRKWGVSCYLGAPVYRDGDLYGTFCFYDTEPRVEPFSDWEVTFVELLSDWVSHELDRKHHLDQLAVLDELGGVVREVTAAVVDQSTREELETVACRGLAEADAYRFAWVGGVDQTRGQVAPRATVGAGDYLDAADLTYGEDVDNTPLGRAVQTGTVQVGRVGGFGSDGGSWEARAERHGVECWAAVPITDEGTVYGVLNVYSARPDAFRDQELQMVEQLGELVGHAITATQRKESLMSEDVVEVEFEVRSAFPEADRRGEAGMVRFDRTVSVGVDDYLLYGGADDAGIETLRAVADRQPEWQSLEVLSDRGAETRFELHLSEPPVVSTVAAHGGRVESARLDGSTYRLTVHLPHGADVHTLVDGVQQSYPDAEVIAQRRTAQREDAGTDLPTTLLDGLTDRQRATVEAAFYGGFFEWPRDSTGEELASSMGVSPATFHQHLRTGERKILAALLASDD